ncbi:MAG: NTP transferase domain-containing protein [Candidatus Hydrogenedentes bacterium]|nr:NTP transferase domain-containing protein [Candidatus Hydrogenedentota bacterium]
MKAVIFAAGKSTRTYPLTLTRPKPLLPVMNRPIIQHQLEALPDSVDEVFLVVGYRHEMIREALGASCAGRKITYVLQQEQRGTGHALLQCRGLIKEPMMAMNGDDLFSPADLRAVAQLEAAALAKRVPDPSLYGVIEMDTQNRLLTLEEKPAVPKTDLANAGVYKLPPAIFDALDQTKPSVRGEIEITSAVQLLNASVPITVVECSGYWLPIGYPWNLLEANTYLLDTELRAEIHGEVSPAAHLSGVVYVGQGTIVRPGVVIDGPVYIGRDCEIGPNCWIRAGSTLGNGCKVGQASEIKNSILFNGAKAPHHNYVGDSVIGEKVNLGCGTVTSNYRHDGATHRSLVGGQLIDTGRRKLGAILGDGVHTGIHTSIYPGRKLWPNTTTLPGEIVDKDRM